MESKKRNIIINSQHTYENTLLFGQSGNTLLNKKIY